MLGALFHIFPGKDFARGSPSSGHSQLARPIASFDCSAHSTWSFHSRRGQLQIKFLQLSHRSSRGMLNLSQRNAPAKHNFLDNCRWVNESAFVSEVQTRPCPTLGRPVHLGFPHRLRPGTSPQALRIPPHDGHPALRSTASGGFRSALAVSSFRLRARLDLSLPSAFSGQRGYEPRFLDMAPLI